MTLSKVLSAFAFFFLVSPLGPQHAAASGDVVITAFAVAPPAVARHDEDSSPSQNLVPSIPSRVVLERVSQSYPVTLWSKLFSSVPKREYALRDVSMTIGWGGGDLIDSDGGSMPHVTLLVGRSGSGKSTLLRLLDGTEDPIEGTVRMESGARAGSSDSGDRDHSGVPVVARPVMIDRKPDVYGDARPIRERIFEAGAEAAASTRGSLPVDASVIEAIVSDFARILGLTDEQLRSPATDLNPSSVFLFGLVCGCMQSSCPALPSLVPADAPKVTLPLVKDSCGIPCPIVLLDELFDFEHPSVTAKCASGLDRLAKKGAAVAVATHKPRHWEGIKDQRVVTLNGGRLL